MTATIPTMRRETSPLPQAVPDAGLVLKRTDRQWRKDNADDPAPEGCLETLTAAVHQQVVKPLADGAPLAAIPVDQDELDRLRTANSELIADNGALADEVATLKAAAQRHTGVVAELDQAQRALGNKDTEVDDLVSKLADLQREFADQGTDLEATRAELATAAAAQEPHRHTYPWIEGTKDVAPCACGHAYPRHTVRDLRHVAPAAVREPFDVLLDRVRTQLDGWPAA
jgi:hypothetical protein